MAIQISSFLGNIKLLTSTNFALGTVSFVFEVVLLIKYNWPVGPRHVAGIWCGIIFILVGLLALYANRKQSRIIKYSAVASAAVAVVFGFVQMGLTSSAIHMWRALSFLNEVQIIRGLLGVILACSLVAIPTNVLLSLTLFNSL